MNTPTSPLVAFSDSIARIVATTAPFLAAIRIGPNRHITGLLCRHDAIITTDQALPGSDRFTVVLSTQALEQARLSARDPSVNLAVLRLEAPQTVDLPDIAAATIGGVVIVLGADTDASPTVRVTVVHRFARTAIGIVPLLDLSRGAFEEGGPVLDASGRLLGLVASGAAGEAMVIPGAAILHMLQPGSAPPSPVMTPSAAAQRRGWLGVALQPITVPDHLVPRVGQSSGRMVVSITTGGPADRAGLRVGDVLLALNGTSVSGPHALRAFLGADRIGSTIEVKLMRDGNLFTTQLIVVAQPG